MHGSTCLEPWTNSTGFLLQSSSTFLSGTDRTMYLTLTRDSRFGPRSSRPIGKSSLIRVTFTLPSVFGQIMTFRKRQLP